MANPLGGQGTESTADTNAGQDPKDVLTQDRRELTQWTLSQLQRLRNFRRPYDQRRAYYYRQYIGQRDGRMYPDRLTPRSNTFVPYPSSNVETVVSRVHDAFFSVDPPIEARTKGGTDDSAMKMQVVLLDCLRRAKWIKALELGTRDCAIYGHMALKVDWDWSFDVVSGPEPVFAMQPLIDQNTGQPVIEATTGQPAMIPVLNPMTGEKIQIGTQNVTKQIPRNCPKFIPIDIYDLLIDPDERMIVHVFECSWGELKRQTTGNPNLYFPEGLAEIDQRMSQYKDLDRDSVLIRMAEVWDDNKKTVTVITFPDDYDALAWKERRYQWRNASYSAYRPRVYNGPAVLLYNGPNQFAHQRIPIIHCPYIKVKGDTYGIGLIEKISDLTEGVNVFVNMITDNWNIGINKRYAYDVNADIDHDQLDMGNVPGGKVGVNGNPNEMLFPLPNFTPNQQDYAIVDLYRGMIEMSSGISDYFAKGMGGPQGNDTAAGINQVIAETGYVFKLFIRNFETEVLQPMCEMVASMIQQFGTAEMEYSITNAPPGIPKYGRVPLADLVGNYEFDFVAANYATGKVVKQRNLMAFYNIALQSPYCNQGEFLREIAKALEIPFANRLLKPDQQVQQEQQATMNSQMQAEVLRELLKFESKALVAGIAKPYPAENSKGPTEETLHALAVQQTVEQFLAETAGVPDAPPAGAHNHEGRRDAGGSTAMETPGGDFADHMRGFSQSNGANALGTSG